ncbi:MAG: starch synthase, partial [Christensenellaceae bacterium]
VIPYNMFTGEGNGFSFVNYNAHDMLNTIRFALDVYKDKSAMQKLIQAAMTTNNSFAKSAAEYIEIYESLSTK